MSKPIEYKKTSLCFPTESKRHQRPESDFPSVDSTCGIMNLTDAQCTQVSVLVHSHSSTGTLKHSNKERKGTDNMFLSEGASRQQVLSLL